MALLGIDRFRTRAASETPLWTTSIDTSADYAVAAAASHK